MNRKSALYATLAALLLAIAFVAVHPAAASQPAQAATPVRIMPLGDSITGSPGCWRALLWNQLRNSGRTNIDFVGTLPAPGCGVTYDGDNEGHGGFLATNIADRNQLPGWLSATRPDIVIMHLGTNDVWSNIPPATILAAFGKLVDQMRASNPAMKIQVAQILPMNPPNCPQCGQRVVSLNGAIPGWAASKSTTRSPVTVVDQWTGFNPASDTGDGVHPNNAGNQKIAARWFGPLSRALDGVPPSTSPSPSAPASPSASPSPSAPPSPSVSPSVSPSPSPSTGRTCSAAYSVLNQWASGFQAEVRVTAGGSQIGGWAVTWTFTNGQSVTQVWNATVSSSGSTVTARNAGYNGGLSAGASTAFGFLGSWSGTNSAPSVSCAAT